MKVKDWLSVELEDDEYYKDIEENEEEEYISSSEAKFLKEWKDIVQAAEHNPTLQKALERVKIIHHLSKD